MRRASMTLGLGFAMGAFAAITALGERDASACGGCFHPPTETASDITDERMLLATSQTQTTLYDQIRYTGSPASFAWVLPIHGTVDVGLSADVLFDSVDTLTATQIQSPPYPNCPGEPAYCLDDENGGGDAGSVSASDASTAAPSGVTVTKQQNVGPYETVQLHATDSSALNNWLTTNGFSIPADVTPVIDEYVKEGFDFLAMKLLPDEGVQAMRPVRVTMPGASLSLPLRMAAIGTGATVGITIWVVADGRYEPQNFPFFHIEDSQLIWDWKTQSSNYTTLRAQNEATLVGKGWEIESSLGLNETLVTNVIQSGGIYYGGGGFGGGGPPAANASDDYLPVGDADGGDGDGGATESADQVRADDIAALFAGMNGPTVRFTRIRSDISHAAMTSDFVLQASTDQAELSNTRFVTNSINAQCPIYSGCTVVGYGSPAQAAAAIANDTGPNGIDGGGCRAAGRAEGDGGIVALIGMLGLSFLRKNRKRRPS